MNNPNEEELGYVSSAPLLIPKDGPKVQDEADISTLDNVFKLLENRKIYYESIASLSLDDKTFDINSQVAINKKVLFHIQEIELLVASAIKKVREKQYGTN